MLGFGRAAVPGRATLQTSDQIVIQFTDMQVPSTWRSMSPLISMISRGRLARQDISPPL